MSIFGTKIYTVHVNPGQSHAYEEPVFIREGFNVYALLFMGFWALYHRLWLVMLLLFTFNGTMMYLENSDILPPSIITVLYFMGQILVGFHANDWHRAKLTRKGYVMADITTGESLLRAEQRFFERHFALSPA